MKIFIGLLTGVVSLSDYTKCVLLNFQPTLIYLHPNEYSQDFHWYQFVVKSNRCCGICNS